MKEFKSVEKCFLTREDVVFKPVHKQFHTQGEEEVCAAFPALRIPSRGVRRRASSLLEDYGLACGPYGRDLQRAEWRLVKGRIWVRIWTPLVTASLS